MCVRVPPLQLVLAECVEDVLWRVVREVVDSIHGFMHGGHVLHRSHLLVLIVIHDVVYAAQTYVTQISDHICIKLRKKQGFLNVKAYLWGTVQ